MTNVVPIHDPAQRGLNERIKNIPIPQRMRKLPIDERGFPIPRFVPYVNGKPEFRGMSGEHLHACVRKKICWLCGEPLAANRMTFVIGPMCAINRNTAEPPCHRSCAQYAAQACPFLSQPKMRRNEKDTPWEPGEPPGAGIGLKRNPGVTLLWSTRSYKTVPDGQGILFRIGDAIHIDVYAEGRKALADELAHSISTGLPALFEMAEEDGPEALRELRAMVAIGLDTLRKHWNSATLEIEP
jgi:hypothetical protein